MVQDQDADRRVNARIIQRRPHPAPLRRTARFVPFQPFFAAFSIGEDWSTAITAFTSGAGVPPRSRSASRSATTQSRGKSALAPHRRSVPEQPCTHVVHCFPPRKTPGIRPSISEHARQPPRVLSSSAFLPTAPEPPPTALASDERSSAPAGTASPSLPFASRATADPQALSNAELTVLWGNLHDTRHLADRQLLSLQEPQDPQPDHLAQGGEPVDQHLIGRIPYSSLFRCPTPHRRRSRQMLHPFIG